MPIANFSLFLSITFLVSASPGPVMLSCMSNGARLGIAKASAGMLGASLGNLCLVALSALGLGLLVSQHDWLFNLLKWAGAGYLVYMGWQIIQSPLHQTATPATRAGQSLRAVAVNGFLIAIGNPKGLLYFGALFPQFIAYQQPLAAQFLVLTACFLSCDIMWMLAYALAGKTIMRWLHQPIHQLWFNRSSGLLLMTAGLFMALTGKS